MSPRHLALALALAGCSGASPALPPPAPSPAPSPPPASASAEAPLPAPTGPVPPVAARVPHVERLHGVELSDDYFWLRQKGTPEVEGYLKAENSYAEALLAPLRPLQQRLYEEMLARIKETDLDVPVRIGEFFYYSRTEKGLSYPIHCRRGRKPGAPEETLLDLNEIGKAEKFVGLGELTPSDDGKLLAYTLDTTGFRQFALSFKDLTTGRVLAEHVERVDGVEFARDGRSVVYVTQHPQTKRTDRLWRHVLGDDPKNDALLYEEKDEKFDLQLGRTRDRAFFVVTSASKTTTEVRVIDARDGRGKPSVVAPRKAGHEYYVDHKGREFYIRENSGGRNFRLVTAPEGSPDRDRWKELVAHRDGVMLEGVSCFKGGVVLREREEGLPHLRFVGFKKGDDHRVAVGEDIYTLSSGSNPGWDEPTFRYTYSSFTTPRSVYDYDPKTRQKELKKRVEVPGFDPAGYESKRLFAVASDGTRVPLSLLYKRGTSPDGTHPMLLRGYGSYGYPYQVRFDSNLFSLIDRGVVFAVAHVRGGGELGKRWHDEGRMQKKANTFGDFIASAEELKRAGWAKKDGLIIEGGSAGGLLVGAVLNARPDLWRGAVAHVPFVDVINTMLDESLPLTVSEFEEWGNPKKKEDYEVMAAYSPYDNVKKQAYPALLVRTSYNDSQVMYWEPAKWVARLRAMKTDQNPLLLTTHLEPAGHGGKSGRYDALRDLALDYAWMLTTLGG